MLTTLDGRGSFALSKSPHFTYEALLDRLHSGVKRNGRPVVVLAGSALSAPTEPNGLGVPTVSGVIDLIRDEFDGIVKTELDDLVTTSLNAYQDAFDFLLARRGQDIVNDVVKRAVWKARRNVPDSNSNYQPTSATDETTCRSFDSDSHSWHLTPALAAFGKLASEQAEMFGQAVLTTNFDPLIEVAVAQAQGTTYRTVLHRDGDLGQTEAAGTHVIHLHGYWYGRDTLHTPRQLTQERPRLRASLAHILKQKTLLVCGYGGWTDVFTRTLFEIIQDDSESPEVLWTTYGGAEHMNTDVLGHLTPGIDRGRVSIYEHVDCHRLFQELVTQWCGTSAELTPKDAAERVIALSSVLPVPPYRIVSTPKRTLHFDQRSADRPPLVEFYVGRKEETRSLDETASRVVFLTGIGGQGKSALAANYVSRHHRTSNYDYLIWRDCKEEAERFESQIASIVWSLVDGSVTFAELAKQPIESLTDLFIGKAANARLLIVFDNIDHYIDLETGKVTGAPGQFCERFLASNLTSKIIFTCRPTLALGDTEALQIRLGGIDAEAAYELFQLRGASTSKQDVATAHSLTRGHAFWLDLLAAQVGRNPQGPSLRSLLADVDATESGLPMTTLHSVWRSLKDREQIVLRGLAETVRPVTAIQLSDYLTSHIRWNQLAKAVKYLRALNLIVVKLQDNRNELLELHPLVRTFIRHKFPPSEQSPYVDSIMRFYLAFFGLHRVELSQRPRSETVEKWIEAAELSTQSTRFKTAFEWLHDVRSHYQSAGQTLEFVRVSEQLLRAADWSITARPPYFDGVASSLINLLVELDRESQAFELIEIYKSTVTGKDARYINLCDLMCEFHWKRGDYFSAIGWGVEGVTLKTETGVDTNFDVGHSLALAQRDSGLLEPALKFFLRGESLEDVLQTNGKADNHGGAFYGNIGRCLHKMGQIDNTLVCYRKSAKIIEEEVAEASFANRGYIREWVGELSFAKGDTLFAAKSFSAALSYWDQVAPRRAQTLREKLGEGGEYRNLESIPPQVAEGEFLAWVRR